MTALGETPPVPPPHQRIELAHASVLFTTRLGGVSRPPFDSLNLGKYTGDDPQCVDENLKRISAWAGVATLETPRQVHGAQILDVDAVAAADRAADGLITSQPRRGLLITGADCPPVVLATATRVMALHCGWRPLAAGIVERALELLAGESFEAAIGPGIGPEHYAVGEEVPRRLGADGMRHWAGGRLDLRGIIVDKLQRAAPRRIEVSTACTFTDADHYFSHRRDNGRTGRQAVIAWR